MLQYSQEPRLTSNDTTQGTFLTSTSNDLIMQTDQEQGRKNKVGLRDRLKHFTWAWFTTTMSTGGLALALGETPHKFEGLHTIGVIVFLFNIILFLLFCALMTSRLIIDPPRFKHSFVNPSESFFFPSFILSLAVILGGIQIYGVTIGPEGTWLITAIRIVYWIYASFSLINVISQYWIFICRTPARPLPMNPSWFLPGYSTMLTGTIASMIAGSQPPEHRVPIIISGCAYQGFGWLISFALIVMYLTRLMESGLPTPSLRPGMFIPIGAPSYTIIALIGQARAIPRSYGYFLTHASAADICQTVALFASIFLWILSFWLLCIALLACLERVREMGFALSWWAFIFPNVGFIVGTVEIGKELNSEGILWVGSAMTICLVMIWLMCIFACVRAVTRGRIMWPGRDEDKDM